MNEDTVLIFKPSSNPEVSIANFNEESKKKLKQYVKDELEERDLLDRLSNVIESIESDDYLYLYYTLYNLRTNYNLNHNIDYLKKYLSEEVLKQNNMYNRQYQIPYVCLQIGTESDMGGRSFTSKWSGEDIYCIEFDYKFIRNYLNFIISKFDLLFDNENRPEDEKCYIGIIDDDIEAKSLLNVLNTGVFYKNIVCEDNKNLKLFNLEGQGINNKFIFGKVPDIYMAKGFQRFCTISDYIVAELIDSAVNSIMAHELAHIANGHIDYKKNKKDFYDNPYISQMLEFDADTTALRWTLSIDFMNGIAGMLDTMLNISMADLIESLEMKIFAYYTILRWKSLEDESIWDVDCITSENNSYHPNIQLRIILMLINAFGRLTEILEMSTKDNIVTKDNKKLTLEIIQNIKNNVLQMIADFENVYAKCEITFTLDYIVKKFDELSTAAKGNLLKCFELWPSISKELEKYSYCDINEYR